MDITEKLQDLPIICNNCMYNKDCITYSQCKLRNRHKAMATCPECAGPAELATPWGSYRCDCGRKFAITY